MRKYALAIPLLTAALTLGACSSPTSQGPKTTKPVARPDAAAFCAHLVNLGNISSKASSLQTGNKAPTAAQSAQLSGLFNQLVHTLDGATTSAPTPSIRKELTALASSTKKVRSAFLTGNASASPAKDVAEFEKAQAAAGSDKAITNICSATK